MQQSKAVLYVAPKIKALNFKCFGKIIRLFSIPGACVKFGGFIFGIIHQEFTYFTDDCVSYHNDGHIRYHHQGQFPSVEEGHYHANEETNNQKQKMAHFLCNAVANLLNVSVNEMWLDWNDV